jgi:hypothetical protein
MLVLRGAEDWWLGGQQMNGWACFGRKERSYPIETDY